MSKKDEFNPWKFDREQARKGQARLTIERHGHEVTLDHQGVSIDGKRIVRDDPSKGDHGFQITAQGTVMYRDQEVAEIEPSPQGTANPGEVTVWGKDGPTLPERRERELAEREREESERKERDSRYRGSERQQQQELTRDGQEKTL
ncbi:hypothetical protein IOD14_44025 (plasmid) [Streptomyces sp. A2-16]|uniref:hypothetical protein n=1 Tax=Streptomyces sp. A2-16 TaxID=2781734 RepID=UPI001BB05116|nr:hypothetical protein [Streptomyces sp. A2-16]QUC63816.1 hypothetical protein IOD14_44025 [Streptomyces sp. A2-16]